MAVDCRLQLWSNGRILGENYLNFRFKFKRISGENYLSFRFEFKRISGENCLNVRFKFKTDLR